MLISASLLCSMGFPARSEDSAKKPPSDSARIDRMIVAQLKAKGEKLNPPASDEVFVRRIYLDIIGRIPTKREALRFLDSKTPDKREELIDRLLDSDGYVSHYYNFWADLLRLRTRLSGSGQSRPAGLAYERWVKGSLRENKHYDDMVRELVTAHGSSWENGAVGYYIRDYGMPLDNLAVTTQIFLGTQIVCAQCHDHPFDKWTQMDYYHLAAFTYGVQATNRSANQTAAFQMAKAERRKKNTAPMGKEQSKKLNRAFSEILKPLRFNNVRVTDRPLKLPADYKYDNAKPRQVVHPETVLGQSAVLSKAEPPIESFADWMTSPENPRFAKVIANRLWKNAFGVGLIEPVDDLKDETVASNPELMTFLEKKMRDFDFDMKRFLRMVYNTEAYQREVSTQEIAPGTPYDFAGPILRRMSAEQIWDSIVAMIVPQPDHPNREHELAIDRSLTNVQLIAESVYDQKPREFLKSANEVLAMQKRLSTEIESAQADLARARKERDGAGIASASRKVRKIRRELTLGIEDKVFRHGLSEKLQLVAMNERDSSREAANRSSQLLNDLAADLLSRGASSDLEEFAGTRKSVIDKLTDILMAEREDDLQIWSRDRKSREMKAWGVKTAKDKKVYQIFASSRDANIVRASEITSPAPGNHFLRAFGQSDRELVNNSNDEASITQALTMLNGPVRYLISNRYSVLFRDLRGESFEDRLETVYLTMYSRRPTPAELKIFRDAWKANPDSGTLSGIVWTILNTRQFLFIQ